ncbi:lysine 2,3-aminomutase [Alkalispirochaeta sphaeroplastigenens]|uniref:L-lysine 2,3-aminomutase n=1 Tax=Alkalispirochaeta sphaeroplastigenens TaxID=1187066 RepID=A0A2S4JZ14_9SPIO|nr:MULTISPECIES: lysine 2,3-aminomutase [Alkalispirochaeta]POR04760.1 lysine 2,3-aminomutase [Alkalispirochaeta sphaeroplastigenens]
MKHFTSKQREIAGKLQENFTGGNWSNWRWHIKHSITDLDSFEAVSGITFSREERESLQKTIETFPLSITPYYLSLIDVTDWQNDPVMKQAFPDARELVRQDYEMADPLSEDTDSPVPAITHRYPDRVLFHVSNSCSMYCRHCTRKRKVGDRDSIPTRDILSQGIAYLRDHGEIRDVLLSGGDPLMLSDSYLEWILEQIREISHIEIIRIGTRMPVVLPYRITDELVDTLKRFQPLYVNTHFNHPREVTGSSRAALKRLADGGIPLGNQTVLLRDVNDCPRIQKTLVQKMLQNRVRPYYLYQCDLSEGLTHFRTPVSKGIEIMESLRGHTSGLAVPTYVVDAPGGGGKIPVAPNYLVSYSPSKVVLRNFEGVITTYREPSEYPHTYCNRDCDSCHLQLKLDEARENNATGITQLLSDEDDVYTLVPENTTRISRRQEEEAE